MRTNSFSQRLRFGTQGFYWCDWYALWGLLEYYKNHAWYGTSCYLGDMLCSGGGCDSTIAVRCSVAWGKFRILLHVLTNGHLSLRIRGKVYKACVRSAMLHASKTLDPNNPKLQWPQLNCRNDHAMICWICGIKDWDEISWCCQPHRMGHRQHLNLKWTWMDGYIFDLYGSFLGPQQMCRKIGPT